MYQDQFVKFELSEQMLQEQLKWYMSYLDVEPIKLEGSVVKSFVIT